MGSKQLLQLSKRMDAAEAQQVHFHQQLPNPSFLFDLPHTAMSFTAGSPLPPMNNATDVGPSGMNGCSPGPSGMFGGEPSPDGEAKGEKYPAARSKNRRVQLSKAVRLTMLDMMGLHSTSGELPEFDPTFPKEVDEKQIWRWEWSKTLAGSDANKAFAAAIGDQVLSLRNSLGKFAEVPADDWQYMHKAIETAYVNLRREYDSRTNEEKRAKKNQTRKRNRRRGLRDEKFRRRKAAIEMLSQDGGEGLQTECQALGLTDLDLVREAVDIKYMSSEDSEVDEGQAESNLEDSPFDDGTEGVRKPAQLHGGSKIFRIRPPAWRSRPFGKLFNRFDVLKPPERAYKRVKGTIREDVEPPDDTPAGLIDADWQAAHPEWPKRKKRKVAA
jgi:hypothetical protein